jgi:hypothetical protein
LDFCNNLNLGINGSDDKQDDRGLAGSWKNIQKPEMEKSPRRHLLKTGKGINFRIP